MTTATDTAADRSGPLHIRSTVDLLPSDEESTLRDAVRSLVAAHGDIEAIRTLTETTPGYSADLWSELTDSMAVTSMAVPEDDGGLGYGLTLLTAVLEECGRALRPEPVLVTAAVGVPALLASDDERAGVWRDSALAGEVVVATSSLTPQTDQLVADGESLTGTVGHVAHGATADLFIVTAADGESRRLFAVSASKVRVETLESLDPTRPLARVTFNQSAGIALTAPSDTEAVVDDLRNRALIALAAESVGICDRILELTREYTLSRTQFDRPIASFQAIKHRLADLLLDLERARSAARYAAAHYDADPASARLAAAIAAVVCSDAAHHVTTDAIQLHGGIGFTWEHAAHNYYRRVLVNDTLFGDAAAQRQRIADELGIA